MPNMFVKIPRGSFPAGARQALGAALSDAAAAAEQMPQDPRMRFFNWVLIEEIDAGAWTCGGQDVTATLLPCVAHVYVPAGVLDRPARADYVQRMQAAFKAALPATEARRLVTSVMLLDVPDGSWGANGAIWTLTDIAKAAGYAHLQHLLQPADATA